MSLDSRPVRQAGGAVVIVLPTTIDVTNAEQVAAELACALSTDVAVLVADMTATEFCDSAGVQMLVRASHQAATAGAGLRLAAGAYPVRRVLELTGADQIMDMYPDLTAAIRGLAVTG